MQQLHIFKFHYFSTFSHSSKLPVRVCLKKIYTTKIISDSYCLIYYTYLQQHTLYIKSSSIIFIVLTDMTIGTFRPLVMT